MSREDSYEESYDSYVYGAEQDQPELGSGDLPTYDDLAAHSGPNSRFGRWRGWIEKRAAERYADISTEDLQRRRERGWGNETTEETIPVINEPRARATSMPLRLRINADLPAVPTPDPDPDPDPSLLQPTTGPSPLPGELLSPTHLRLHQFGSRFLPHCTSPIRCLLPLQSDRLLLIGHDRGLSVLNMYPQEWAETGGIMQKGPDEAQSRPIWTGEAVYQLSILEYEDAGDGPAQGVVLALVGPDVDPSSASHQESVRTLRMYNLASLTSLAKWTIAQRGTRPLDLRRPSDWHPQQTPKKHRPASSITRGLRSLMVESPTRTIPTQTSFQSLLPTGEQRARRKSTSASMDSTWDVLDDLDLPLRWAADYVPLAGANSRMSSSSVISYALWQEGGRYNHRALLAVATKSNIYLYETPKGERAFHFVKEFYTPIQPRSLVFVQQSVQDIFRSPSDVGPLRTTGGYGHNRVASTESSFSLYNPRNSLVAPVNVTYAAQPAIFVIFDKKAGVIRIADAAVTEIEMYDTGGSASSSSSSVRDTLTASSSRRSRMSVDFAAMKEMSKGLWVLPSKAELPATRSLYPGADSRSVYLLTRGKQTHIVPSPLPASVATTPPLYTITWKSHPSSVSPRVCKPPRSSSSEEPPSPFLQLVGMGEDGIEVHEVPLSLLSKGKGKATGTSLSEPVYAQSFIGEAGYLVSGGHWHRPPHGPPQLSRTQSATSIASFESLETEEIVSKLKEEQGVYGWWRKDVEDWRIFWAGGCHKELSTSQDD
ncbi:hypothetical protein BV22DRAFT_1101159 [Leucogyrophana mollusca]|uniref:Uncharacterized protein n=1 Tax=Leucogyrophana mollusca TaxID=85980 RepID=A0ACB8C1U6_9AGAM|nr:hypothetical protein BV22DRAFT_1101159 [Leucogyrophana mollusca]